MINLVRLGVVQNWVVAADVDLTPGCRFLLTQLQPLKPPQLATVYRAFKWVNEFRRPGVNFASAPTLANTWQIFQTSDPKLVGQFILQLEIV